MSLVKFETVKSSQINEVGHDAEKQILYIRFRNKKMYEYYPVTTEEFVAFKTSDSIGKYFHANIKKRVIIY